jgi:hypothetical protein
MSTASNTTTGPAPLAPLQSLRRETKWILAPLAPLRGEGLGVRGSRMSDATQSTADTHQNPAKMARQLGPWLFLLSWCSLILCFLSPSLQAIELGTRESRVEQAQSQFDSATTPEDFRVAAEVYESLLQDGLQNGAIHFNIGNAYFRAQEYGRAILHYRQAHRFRPKDPYVKANLEQALLVAPGRLAEPLSPWWQRLFFWTHWFSPSFKVLIAAITLALSGWLFLVVEWLQLRSLRWLILVAALLSSLFAMDAWLSVVELNRTDRAIVVRETTARKGIGDTYAAAFDKPLRDGAEFTILNQSNSWTFGRFEGIGDGWVRNESIAR